MITAFCSKMLCYVLYVFGETTSIIIVTLFSRFSNDMKFFIIATMLNVISNVTIYYIFDSALAKIIILL